MTHLELAEDAIEDEFPRVLEWVDYDVQCALIKAIYNSVKLKQNIDIVMFAKSLVEEIDSAALKYTEAEFENSQGDEVTTSWANRQSAMYEVGHSPKDFA
jgi:hypothetical protein